MRMRGANISSIYTIGDLETALADASTGYPVVNMFFNATQNLAAADFMTVVIVVNFTAANIACIAATSRQVWAFARNHGLPFSNIIAPVCAILSFLRRLTSVGSPCIRHTS
jgi:choline transport protein